MRCLTVNRPPHARWVGKPPSDHSVLDRDITTTWVYRT